MRHPRRTRIRQNDGEPAISRYCRLFQNWSLFYVQIVNKMSQICDWARQFRGIIIFVLRLTDDNLHALLALYGWAPNAKYNFSLEK